MLDKPAIETRPSYMGQYTNQGQITIGREYPNEGYALIRCGGTEVKIGYTALHNMIIASDSSSPHYADQVAFRKAIWAITAEASVGKTPP